MNTSINRNPEMPQFPIIAMNKPYKWFDYVSWLDKNNRLENVSFGDTKENSLFILKQRFKTVFIHHWLKTL